MPTFDYSGEVTKRFGSTTVLAGHRFQIDEYLADDDVTLVSHLPQIDPPPINTMFSDDIVAGTVSDVTVDQNYDRLSIYNICGGNLRFYVNDDADNSEIMPNNSFWTLDNRKKKIGTIHLSGEASGRVDVNGDMNTL